MKNRRTLEKRMRQLDASGRGHFYEVADEGQILCSVKLENGVLDICMDGFFISKKDDVPKILFEEVVAIKSHLNASFFSGEREDFDFYLPIDIECESFGFSLFVPFLSYSNVLNILTGLRDDWLKQALF
ncbi:hypothetical protein HBO40_28835 [Pseudomonas protegens]|uniref:hypothetical protein n=1 Tax=Pseudomonas protegens TaxID=380021 RepID=UPI0012D71BA2|nr:hypothetical protein [Pseudomonas protegens]MDX9680343.1 hypothetical protein [Pseudomonas protegens]NAN54109.1 hypothetical protein [Pseudomonas protegens]NMZ31653.1 hypothetical protein [Pseudomonas protegens]NMZ89373.1 hypothetical protein [Pseudomonas protegens]NUE79329.1 hypothetical protein [Pseudomonas protegens]